MARLASQATLAAEVYGFRSGQAPEAFRTQFERLLPWYRHFLRPWLPEDRGSRLLDLPCGAGNLLFALKALGYTNVAGLDSDTGQVAVAQRLGLPAEDGDVLAF